MVLQGQGTYRVGIKIGREGDARVDFESGDEVFAGQPGWWENCFLPRKVVCSQHLGPEEQKEENVMRM